MNRKQQFLNAVQFLAPDDQALYQRAQTIPEASLPGIPGGAALEFVCIMERIKRIMPCRYPTPKRKRCPARLAPHQQQGQLSPSAA